MGHMGHGGGGRVGFIPRGSRGNSVKEHTSSIELETGSAPDRGVETGTSLGEQNATSARPQSLKSTLHHHFHSQAVTKAEVALVAYG